MAKVKRLRSKWGQGSEVRSQKVISDLPFHNAGLAYIVCILAAFLLITVCQGVAFAQAKPEQKKPEAKKAEPAPPKFNVGDFTYTSSNRRDPFEPIFLTNPKQPGQANALRKGYELEELKLVGIMKTGNKNLAMMEDMQGRGMLFKKNDYLNKNLWIVDILTEKVEFGYKIKGEIKTFTIDIPRKKEGM
ncbi:MAG: pilus assembly protein PilP [Proteobacteria bacterium]|nr:pilus assembly protein PilP [Pseudomonadota bacterium]